MEVVIYLVLLFMAFGAGVGLAWKLRLANKFVTQRQLDRTLAEQRVMRNLMDEELAIIAADNRKDLASFDRQLNPTKIETVQGQLVSGAQKEGPTYYMAVPELLPQGWKYTGDHIESTGDDEFRSRGLITGQVLKGHNALCNCDICLPLRHGPSTVDCGCQACKTKVALQLAQYGLSTMGQASYLRAMSGYDHQIQQQYQTMSSTAYYMTNGSNGQGMQMTYAEHCSICQGGCRAIPRHQHNPRLSDKSAR